MISSELTYSNHFYPNYVPVNATLIYEVKLQGINEKTMDSEGWVKVVRLVNGGYQAFMIERDT